MMTTVLTSVLIRLILSKTMDRKKRRLVTALSHSKTTRLMAHRSPTNLILLLKLKITTNLLLLMPGLFSIRFLMISLIRIFGTEVTQDLGVLLKPTHDNGTNNAIPQSTSS